MYHLVIKYFLLHLATLRIEADEIVLCNWCVIDVTDVVLG